MNVAFASRWARFHAGAERYVHDVASELRRRGWTCGLVHDSAAGEPAAEYLAAFSWSEGLPWLTAGVAELRRGWAALVERRAVGVAYVHKLDRTEALAALSGDVRVVRMVHDHEGHCLTGRKYFFLHSQAVCHRPLGAGCYVRCLGVRRGGDRGLPLRIESLSERRRALAATESLDAIVVASRYMRQELLRNGLAPERVHVVPLPARAVERPSPHPGAARVLFVGRLHREKGVADLLRALARLRTRFEADVFGDGDVRGTARLAERLGLGARVRVHGSASNGALDAAYRAADVVAVPSRWPEPFGLVGLEAMAHARPVVAYATGGIPEWLEDGETGILVERLDEQALAAALGRLLADPGLARRMGENGRRRILEGPYRPERHAEQLERILTGASPAGATTRPPQGALAHGGQVTR